MKDRKKVGMASAPKRGMRCPNCECKDLRVYMTRPTHGAKAIRRVRKCRNCGYRFETIETIKDSGP